MREAVEVGEADDGPLLRREPVERRVHRAVHVPAGMRRLVRLGGGGGGVAQAAEGERALRLPPEPVPAAEPVDRAVPRDAEEPWHEPLVLLAEPPDVPPYRGER